MTHPTFAAAAGIGVAIALGFMGFGCSSSSSSGTGGKSGSGGASAAGGATGSGGATGTGGASADAGAALPVCTNPASPADKSMCDSNPSCTKNCGVNISAIDGKRAMKACTCSGAAPSGMWSCPSTNGACVYPTDIDLTCFKLPTGGPPLCPSGGADGGAGDGGADAGSSLIKSGNTPCTPPNSEVCGNVCGSGTVNSYQDSSGAPKMGYCACVAGTYQCASVNEWPMVP